MSASSRSLTSPHTGQLRRLLGLGFGLAVIVGSTIGVGILRTPGLVAGHLHSASAILVVWMVGGLYTLLGAVCLAELGTMVPQAGGYYVYARRAFGDWVGFARRLDGLAHLLHGARLRLDRPRRIRRRARAGARGLGAAGRDRRAARDGGAPVGGPEGQRAVPGMDDRGEVPRVSRARRRGVHDGSARRARRPADAGQTRPASPSPASSSRCKPS